jgi:hypothetical protein
MNVSGVSMYDSLASLAVDRANSQTRAKISMAVLSQTIDQAKQQGQMLVDMIAHDTPSPDGVGANLNVLA